MRFSPALVTILASLFAGSADAADSVAPVIKLLNADPTVAGTAESKSYKILFDAFLKMTKPPVPVDSKFNLGTIHPGMAEWVAVADWAESNGSMADALLACRDKNIVGLPYGRDQVPPEYREAGVMIEVGVDGSLRENRFPYLQKLDQVSAFATAEVYRLMEAGQTQRGLDLAMAHIFLLRQFADRDFLAEKIYAIDLLSQAMSNLRDMFYLYQDKITAEQFTEIGKSDIPFLRPDRNRLLMPEADRKVSEALIKEVFDPSTGNPDPTKFARSFASIQAADEPLTQFGAAKRWKMISEVHGSLDSSLERLGLVYDDWWRRWRIQEYDPILDVPTQFDRTNEVRYAAVIYSMQDIESLFPIRNRLIAEINGTAMAAGLCAYKKVYGNYPNDAEKIYAQFVRKYSDVDPFDKAYGPFLYRLVSKREPIDTSSGRVWIPAGECILYSRGQDHEDGRGAEHSRDGLTGDLVIWPPIDVLQRKR